MASYHSSTSARQQSFLRSLSVIHRLPSPTGIRNDISPAHSICNKSQSKFQRRRATVTNTDTAQPIKITNETRRERRRTMEARMTANNDSNSLNKLRRQASVTSARVEEQHENGFRRDYTIGETLRSSSHISIEENSEQAIQAIDSLYQHDFAFIKRSDGSYTYAILAYRSMEPMIGAENNDRAKSMEECMTFVVSEAGATKMVRRRNWSKLLRLVCTSSSPLKEKRTSPVPYPDIKNDEECLVPATR